MNGDDYILLGLYLLALGVFWVSASSGWFDEFDFDEADRDEPDLTDEELDRVRGE